MKKVYTFIICCSILFSISVFQTYGQVGSVCDSAYVINSLPFNVTGLSTATSGNHYNTLSCAGTFPNYISGNDFVFKYTPATNKTVKVTLSNTSYAVGVFITSDCPDVATGCVASNNGLTGNPVIPTANLTGGTTYYITVSSVSFSTPSTAFDIEVKELLAFDAATAKVISPVSNCGLTNAEAVIVKYKNLGTQSINNFMVGYSLNGTPISPVTITTPLNAGDSLSYTFTQTVDLSVIGSYQLTAYIFLTGDLNTVNDTIHNTVAHQAYVNTLPYSQDFEAGDGGWTAGGTNSSWALGTPACSVINAAAPGGVKSWKTNLTGDFNTGEDSYVVGPCFDFTNYPHVSMKMDIWYETSQIADGARVEASTDGGTTWFIIGNNNEPTNWYNAQLTDILWTGSANGWKTAQHPLDSLGGKNNVRIHVVYKAGIVPLTAEGFAFDNIRIYACDSMPTSGFTSVINANGVNLTNTSTNATGYLWDFGDQLSIQSDTNANTSHTYLTPGTYTITLSAFNECGVSHSSQSVTITSIVGIEEITSQNLIIYPNPAKALLNVRLNSKTEVVQKIQIFNILGQEVYNDSSPKSEGTININNLSKGVYSLKVTTNKNLLSRKFTVD